MHAINEEDEDVVIQGSALHEHLSKLGYTDFESISVSRKTYDKPQKHYFNLEKSFSEKQLSAILNAETLFSDHFSMINSLITKCNYNSKKLTLQQLIMTGTILISSTYISLCEHKILPALLTSSAICCIGYLKYLRFYANRNLKNVILLQNELFLVCKDSFNILRRDYTMKLDFEMCLQQFSHFLGDKLQYLESLKTSLIQFMENISCIYYKCSLSIAKLLPPDAFDEELFTKFERNSFELPDEIDYQALKKLYLTYLLVQSEMLYLLAIAYDSNTWICSCQKIPETKLAHIIKTLAKELAIYKIKLSENIKAYRTCKTEPVRHKIQDRAKWHDPSVQLDLASYKLQVAYNQVFSIFKDIDDCINHDMGINNETADILMQKLNRAFKEIDTAKTLAEFVVLLMAKSGFSGVKNNQSAVDTTINQNPDLPVIIDSDPQILDEVFEEYIKEEYLKSFDEDKDEYLLEQQKLDKFLAKSFMSELKEALVDKQKSMSERESRALQRIYKNALRDSISNTEDDNCQVIPTPPPMPSYCIWSTPNSIKSDYKKAISPIYKIKNDLSIQRKSDELNKEDDLVRTLKQKNIFDIPSTEICKNKDEESVTSLPQILLETQVTKLPLPFLYEETFIGSGENSEDEIIDSASDNKEDNENFQ